MTAISKWRELMGKINPQAEALNQIILDNNPAVYDLLSHRGRAIFFPKSGIIKQSAEAKGKTINATIGMAMEDDGTPMRLPGIAKAVNMDPGDVFPYASSYGKPEMRKVWQEMIRKKNPSLKGKISLPVVTSALTHGLSMCGYLFADPGDKIIITDKFWGNYRLIFENGYGAELDPFNTFKNGGFDTDGFRDKLRGKGKKIILLNFPNNPSGYTPTDEEANEITGIIRQSAEQGNPVAVLTDDAYFGLVYKPGIYKESMFAKLADLHENVLAVKIDGATKEDYVWGFRVGFITYASKGITDATCTALEDKTGGAVRGNISNAPHISQSLVLQSMTSGTYAQEKADKYRLLKKRFDMVEKVFADNREKYMPCFTPLPFNSGYFMCVELHGLEGEPVRKLLLDKYSTGTIAVGNLIRVAYSCTPTDKIEEVFENLYQACRELKG